MPRSPLRPDGRRLAGLKAGLILWAFVAAVAVEHLARMVGTDYQFALNETDSLPNWAFIVDATQRDPKRGEYFAFIAPPNPYYPAGMRFTKQVVGVPGDVVTTEGRAVFVDGRPVGIAKASDREGHPAIMSPGGTIPPGHYFMLAPGRDSLDSRYAVIGLIDRARLVGRAYPVL